MNIKTILALIGVMLFGAGLVMAISGAGVTDSADYRWTGLTPGNVTIEGGNISETDINGTTLTDRWAAFWGDVTGAIVLGNQSTYVYQWAWNATDGTGEVCLSTNSAFPFVPTLASLGPADVDTQWGFSSGSDQAVDTFSGNCSALTFIHNNVSDAAMITHKGNSNFKTCGIADSLSPSGKGDFAFCTVIQSSASGKNYNNVAANYEVMVPTKDGAYSPSATEIYYFYAELN